MQLHVVFIGGTHEEFAACVYEKGVIRGIIGACVSECMLSQGGSQRSPPEFVRPIATNLCGWFLPETLQ